MKNFLKKALTKGVEVTSELINLMVLLRKPLK
ncbi:hypothetical protein HNR74_003459 [Flammeovirga kamogawensis]|nr:hypothetical protein [Flammeovirga kamogawensis]